MARNFCKIFNGIKPVTAMVMVQALLAGVNICYKVSVNDGMNVRVLIAYRFIFATAFVAPIALVLERKNRPRLTWKIAFQGFLSGLFGGALGQNLYIESLALTSTTFAVAMANLIPAATFVLAIAFRMEKLGIGTPTGKCKLVGTVLGIIGAMILTLYKGKEINLWSTHINLIKNEHNHQFLSSHQELSDQFLGSILALSSCLSYAIWYMIQAKMSKNYPCKYSSTAITCFTASIQSTVFALCVERDWSAWKLGWNIRLFTAAYTGALATGLTLAITTWCIRIRGPFFVSIFNPLVLIFVAFVGSFLLEEKLHIGSFLGSILIIIGLYAVSWGKGIEIEDQLAASKSLREPEITSEILVPCCVDTSIAIDHDQTDPVILTTASEQP